MNIFKLQWPNLKKNSTMKHNNFQNRIVFLSVLPGIVAAIALAAFFIVERSYSLDNMLESRALTIAKYFAPSCEYGLITGNLGILQNIAQGILNERDMRSVSIYDVDMTELVHAGPKFHTHHHNNYQLKNEQQFLLQTDHALRARAPIFAQHLNISDIVTNELFHPSSKPEEIIGWIEVELSNSNTRILRYQYIVTVILILAIALALCAMVVVRFSRNVSVPLRQLLGTLKDLENGSLDSRVTLNNKGEFSELANGINAMANALQRGQVEYQQHIEQITRDLYENLDEMEIRNNELIIGRQEAQEASRIKSEFLANVSHEIRTPLNGILGFTEVLARTHLSDQQTEYLTTIHNSAEDLLKILNDILDLSKIDAGKLIIERTAFNLRSLVEDVLLMLAPTAYNKGIELNLLMYTDVPIRALGDPLRIKQVLLNLLSNALKFTHRGSVNIRISTINKTQDYASLHFEVQDTGIGISETQVSKIFNAFSQADSSTTRRFGGTGLGLVISKALVEAMGGEMNVSSQVGSGSIFSFYIDVGLDHEEDEEQLSLTDFHAALIIPSLMHRLNTSSILNYWGLKHDDFETPTQLLNFAQEQQPNWQVILYAMGDLQPQDPLLSNQIKQLKALGLPIVASTNLLNDEHIQGYKRIGVDHILTHPCTHKNLYRLVRAALNLPSLESDDLTLLEANSNRKKPIVLAVDDNAANLQLVISLLEELKIPTLAAKSGQEAIDIIFQEEVDMVLMDIQMPEMNGLEATERIRQLNINQNVPIIALTAHAMMDEKEKLLKIGMNDYYTKPINQEKLIACIERWTGYRCQPSGTPSALQKLNTTRVNDGIFDAQMALRNANYNGQLASELFIMLLDSLAEETVKMMDAWEEEDYQTLEELVHKMHGGARYCGVPKLIHSLETLEVSLKTQSSQHWPNLLRNTVEQITALKNWAASHEWRSELL